MPKGRKKSGSRNVAKKLFIICEGAAHKSEPAYFEALKKDLTFAGDKIDIEIVNTKYNTGKELVKVAKQKLFDGFKDIDEAWIVYDKDGYTKHAETFDTASANKIHIAFSSISFEEWILLHFTYTTRPFPDSDEVIKYIKDNCGFVYEKADTETYEKIKGRLPTAKKNAKQLRLCAQKGNPAGTPIYEMNPYTNIDELVEQIENLVERK